MLRLLPLVLCVTIAIAAPVPPEDDATRMRRIYGTIVDPDQDGKFEMKGEKLQIKVPGLHYILVPRTVGKTAPWVGKDIKGDFTAIVRVAFPIRVSTGFDWDGEWKLSYAAAGLIAWVSEKAHLRVQRREESSEDGRNEHFTCDFRDEGRSSGTGTLRRDRDKAESAFLRLLRVGDTVSVDHSRDGKVWTELNTYKNISWGDNVKVGVIAENGYKAPFIAVFDQYTFTQPKKQP